MLKSRHIIFVLLPALLIVGIIFGIRAFQYKVLFYDIAKQAMDTAPELELIPIFKEDPIVGSPTASQTLIVFEDFACEGCKSQNSILKDLEQQHPGKVKIIWKGLPVATFPFSSKPTHEYAYCSNEQEKFIEFKELAFANYTNLSKTTLEMIAMQIELDQDILKKCFASEKPLQYVETVRQLAQILHVQHVPTFFLDNAQIPTPASIEEWEAILGL
jgi:protein-disulfide isomerase